MSNESFFAITFGAAILAAGANAPREHFDQVVRFGERVVAESRYEYDAAKSLVEGLPREVETAGAEIQGVWHDFSAQVVQKAIALKHQIDYQTRGTT